MSSVRRNDSESIVLAVLSFTALCAGGVATGDVQVILSGPCCFHTHCQNRSGAQY